MQACRLFGRCRQAYYQSKADIERDAVNERRLVAAVRQIREHDPRLGGYKLWLMLGHLFGRECVPGRDRFFRTLRRKGLMLAKAKPRCTTNSNHRYHKWKNRIKGLVPSSPNRVWVADITYIALAGGDVAYLHLVTDAYSRKIVGWAFSDSLKSVHTIEALQMALSQAESAGTGAGMAGLIHHSDRGVQYCCDDYVKLLQEHNVTISMTEDYNPTDNAIAERANGIIKTECLYRQPQLPTYGQARQLVSDFITFYNCSRPHLSIGGKTPEMAHHEQGWQKKMWKKRIYGKKDGANKESMLSLHATLSSEAAASEDRALLESVNRTSTPSATVSTESV